MYILLVYERELSKNDYLRPLLITIIITIIIIIKPFIDIFQINYYIYKLKVEERNDNNNNNNNNNSSNDDNDKDNNNNNNDNSNNDNNIYYCSISYDVTKIQTIHLLILLRIYCHDV